MEKPAPKSFDFAADLVKQLITLSTGVIALTITFAKDIVGSVGSSNGADSESILWLTLAWIGFSLSIVFGIWALMALTGTLEPKGSDTAAPSIQGWNCRVPIGLQIFMFLSAIGCTIFYTVRSL
ncbi:MAG TPA: hypothetical protein VJ837_03530 [Candidatus Paceibacterota bacterium]|nr:hypothetical protein [Candidatus Paceibacterota bacterium]